MKLDLRLDAQHFACAGDQIGTKRSPQIFQAEGLGHCHVQCRAVDGQLDAAAQPQVEAILSDLGRQRGAQSRHDFLIVPCHFLRHVTSWTSLGAQS
jgi:hypothetical protein